MVLKGAGFDSTRMKNEAEMTIMMYLYEQMVWHSLVPKVLVGQMVKIFFVQMFLRTEDGRLSFYYHRTMELGCPSFDNRVYHLPDVYYQLLVDDLLGQKMSCGLNYHRPKKGTNRTIIKFAPLVK